MIDLNLYRIRIGTFTRKTRTMKFLRKYEATNESSIKAGQNTLFIVKLLLKIVLFAFILPYPNSVKHEICHQSGKAFNSTFMPPHLLASPPFTNHSAK